MDSRDEQYLFELSCLILREGKEWHRLSIDSTSSRFFPCAGARMLFLATEDPWSRPTYLARKFVGMMDEREHFWPPDKLYMIQVTIPLGRSKTPELSSPDLQNAKQWCYRTAVFSSTGSAVEEGITTCGVPFAIDILQPVISFL
jgi:hypothetical protein